MEFETTRRAPASPIDRYLDELRRNLDVSPRQRRRIVSEVGEHLRELADEEVANHGLSPWESERAAITRMGNVDSIVGGYELSQPRRSRTTGKTFVALTAAAVVGCGALAYGVHHRRHGESASVTTTGRGCMRVSIDKPGATVLVGDRFVGHSETVCRSGQRSEWEAWTVLGPDGRETDGGVVHVPTADAHRATHTRRATALAAQPIVIHPSGCTHLPYTLNANTKFVRIEVVRQQDGRWYKHFLEHGRRSGRHAYTWCGSKHRYSGPLPPGIYWWYVWVRWKDRSTSLSDAQMITVRG